MPNLEGIGTNTIFWERVYVMGAQAPILATPEDNALYETCTALYKSDTKVVAFCGAFSIPLC